MKKFFMLMLALVFVLMLASCGDETTGSSSSTNASSNVDSTGSGSTDNSTSGSNDSDGTGASSVPNTPPDPDDPIGPSEGDEPELDTSVQTVTGVLGDSLKAFDAADTFGNEGQISSYTKYTAEYDVSTLSAGDRVNIATGGIFRVYGKSLNSQIYIKAKDQNVILVLDGLDLISTGSGPAIYAEDCSSVTIVLAEGSENRLEDSAINGENGVIKVKSCNLTMDGKGKLTIKANGKHGISNTKELTINGGTYVITSTRHGIYGKLGLTINGGKYVISSARSGFKSGDDEVGKEAEGKIVINSCSAVIRCNTNGINSYGTVEINNGRITVESKMGKAIDATKNININGGTMIFSTPEDAIKTDADVFIEGSTNIKITTNGNGIECANLTASTSGVIYIKTIPSYVENTEGIYKLDGGEYVLIGENEVFEGTRYELVECKGIEVDGDIKLSNATVGIDSFEDCLNATNINVKNSLVVLSTTKDAMDASSDTENANITVEGVSVDVKVLSSDKGLKAKNTITLMEGSTSIVANTDAIKADTVLVQSGTHLLFDKVEYVTNFTIRGGMLVCISTTANPVSVRSTIPNASGIIENKDLCVFGQQVKLVMGSEEISLVLPKDYTEKICVLFAAEDEQTAGESTTITIGEATEALTKGAFN